MGKDPKSVHEIITALTKNLNRLQRGHFKDQDKVSKILKRINEMIYGNIDTEPESEAIRSQIAEELYKNDILLLFIENLNLITFEGKKDILQIFGHIINRRFGTRLPSVEYILKKSQIVWLLIEGYENNDLAFVCGQIIRDCIRYEALAQLVLNIEHENDYKLFDYLRYPSFAISSDVFLTLQDLLTRHKTLVKNVFEKDYKIIFKKLNELLDSQNYYMKRKSIKLLSELLFDRNNQKVMKRYISSAENFNLINSLFQSSCRFISIQAFLVITLFVSNPQMSQQIKDILLKSKQSLIESIENLRNDGQDFEQYEEEKSEVIKILVDLN
jgi:calcium binding protein 39